MTRGIESALWGTATRDAEIRTSKSGNEFGVVNLMTNDGTMGDDGKPITTFVKVLAFGQHVNTARGIRKSDRVYCEGSLSASIWRTVNGSLKLTHFRFDRRLQSDPPLPVNTAWPGGIDRRQSTFSFALFGRAIMPARRLSFRR
jgi:single-stranded DNA-binding protein